MKRQAPVIEVTMVGMTPPPRSKEGTHPHRVSRAEHGTPTESGALRRSGRPPKMEESLSGKGMPRANAGGESEGNHNVGGCSSK